MCQMLAKTDNSDIFAYHMFVHFDKECVVDLAAEEDLNKVCEEVEERIKHWGLMIKELEPTWRDGLRGKNVEALKKAQEEDMERLDSFMKIVKKTHCSSTEKVKIYAFVYVSRCFVRRSLVLGLLGLWNFYV
ncbi:hypothetical protein CTI12_AA288410 [Artemisia annua]|uniref:Uncharacterized protein n=1 Tax=Artemisia annua TaxID=35608 RepID=A0A2U1N9C4_ARTAN|nr:hypothetical protein CTI12_AA288410 [Artemisia annua]